MPELIKRLRSVRSGNVLLCREAADVIERLRAALRYYAECSDGCTCGDGWDHTAAKEALGMLPGGPSDQDSRGFIQGAERCLNRSPAT